MRRPDIHRWATRASARPYSGEISIRRCRRSGQPRCPTRPIGSGSMRAAHGPAPPETRHYVRQAPTAGLRVPSLQGCGQWGARCTFIARRRRENRLTRCVDGAVESVLASSASTKHLPLRMRLIEPLGDNFHSPMNRGSRRVRRLLRCLLNGDHLPGGFSGGGFR